MKIEVKKIDGTKTEMSIEVRGELIKNKFEQVFKKITQEAKVPGFRPGNAPRDIIEKNFSSLAHEQVMKELIPDLYNQALGEKGLDVIDLPNITDVKLDRSALFFKATVETAPEIRIRAYKGIKVNYKNIEVAPDEVKRSLDSLKESRKLESVDDGVARTLGYPNLAELEKTIERQLFVQKENSQRQQIENEIVEAVSKDAEFKLPESLVSRQLQEMLRQAKVDLAMRGVPRDKIEEQEKSLLAELEPEARKQAKIYLILSEIAKKEKIPVDDHMPRKVMEFLLKEAEWVK